MKNEDRAAGSLERHRPARKAERRIEGRKSWIVRRGSEYLVAMAYIDKRMVRWSTSAYDAARIQDRDKAEKVAGVVGGTVVIFDRITGDVEEEMTQ